MNANVYGQWYILVDSMYQTVPNNTSQDDKFMRMPPIDLKLSPDGVWRLEQKKA